MDNFYLRSSQQVNMPDKRYEYMLFHSMELIFNVNGVFALRRSHGSLGKSGLLHFGSHIFISWILMLSMLSLIAEFLFQESNFRCLDLPRQTQTQLKRRAPQFD